MKAIASLIGLLVVLIGNALGIDFDQGSVTEAVSVIVGGVLALVTAFSTPPTKKDIQNGSALLLALIITPLMFPVSGCQTWERITSNPTGKAIVQLAVNGASYAFAKNYPGAAPYLIAVTDLLRGATSPSDAREMVYDGLDGIVGEPEYRGIAAAFAEVGISALLEAYEAEIHGDEFQQVADAVALSMRRAVQDADSQDFSPDSPVLELTTATVFIR